MPALARAGALEPDAEIINRVREDYAQAVLEFFEPDVRQEGIAPVPGPESLLQFFSIICG